jgi:DNA-binding NtrC family response regulator
MSFLIVDGDRNFREALAIALRLDGRQVTTARTAPEALSVLDRGGIRCCVVDWGVEGADELLEAATRCCARTVLTGVHPTLVASTARRHERVETLTKPFGAEALVSPASPSRTPSHSR